MFWVGLRGKWYDVGPRQEKMFAYSIKFHQNVESPETLLTALHYHFRLQRDAFAKDYG